MSARRIFVYIMGAVSAALLHGAQAATISLSPLSQSATLGGPASFQLMMDFSADPTLGGGVDIFYDSSRLSFVSFSFDPGLGDDPDFRRLPDSLPGQLSGLAFGEFNGLSGPAVVGTLTFNTVALGTATLSLTDNVAPAGGFYSAVTFNPQAVTYQGAAVTVAMPAVPLPAAIWMFLGGLVPMGIGFVRQRRPS